MEEERPIGWWVRRLHSLATGTEREADVATALADFPGDVDTVVADLLGRGWVVRTGTGRIGLTPDGAAAHDRVDRAVGRVRRHVADGLSRSEYERTVLVLSRMVANIERALGRGDRRGSGAARA